MIRALNIAREQRDDARAELAHVRSERDSLIARLFGEEESDGGLDTDPH